MMKISPGPGSRPSCRHRLAASCLPTHAGRHGGQVTRPHRLLPRHPQRGLSPGNPVAAWPRTPGRGTLKSTETHPLLFQVPPGCGGCEGTWGWKPPRQGGRGSCSLSSGPNDLGQASCSAFLCTSQTHAHTHMLTHTHTHTHTPTYACSSASCSQCITLTQAHMHMHTFMLTCTHAHMHA